jgi:hypothetical protein
LRGAVATSPGAAAPVGAGEVATELADAEEAAVGVPSDAEGGGLTVAELAAGGLADAVSLGAAVADGSGGAGGSGISCSGTAATRSGRARSPEPR